MAQRSQKGSGAEKFNREWTPMDANGGAGVADTRMNPNAEGQRSEGRGSEVRGQRSAAEGRRRMVEQLAGNG
jgi:hypothetical protein